jgi:hypothetical protein
MAPPSRWRYLFEQIMNDWALSKAQMGHNSQNRFSWLPKRNEEPTQIETFFLEILIL